MGRKFDYVLYWVVLSRVWGLKKKFNFQFLLQILSFQIKFFVFSNKIFCHIWAYLIKFDRYLFVCYFVPFVICLPVTFLWTFCSCFLMEMIYWPASRRMPARYFILTWTRSIAHQTDLSSIITKRKFLSWRIKRNMTFDLIPIFFLKNSS